jgi:hypothetical protein
LINLLLLYKNKMCYRLASCSVKLVDVETGGNLLYLWSKIAIATCFAIQLETQASDN